MTLPGHSRNRQPVFSSANTSASSSLLAEFAITGQEDMAEEYGSWYEPTQQVMSCSAETQQAIHTMELERLEKERLEKIREVVGVITSKMDNMKQGLQVDPKMFEIENAKLDAIAKEYDTRRSAMQKMLQPVEECVPNGPGARMSNDSSGMQGRLTSGASNPKSHLSDEGPGPETEYTQMLRSGLGGAYSDCEGYPPIPPGFWQQQAFFAERGAWAVDPSVFSPYRELSPVQGVPTLQSSSALYLAELVDRPLTSPKEWSPEEDVPFQRDDRTAAQPITTMIILDIPCRKSIVELIALINMQGFANRYDLVYMPAFVPMGRRMKSQATKAAFVNFKHPDYAAAFESRFCKQFKRANSFWTKPAMSQGYEANIEEYSKQANAGHLLTFP